MVVVVGLMVLMVGLMGVLPLLLSVGSSWAAVRLGWLVIVVFLLVEREAVGEGFPRWVVWSAVVAHLSFLVHSYSRVGLDCARAEGVPLLGVLVSGRLVAVPGSLLVVFPHGLAIALSLILPLFFDDQLPIVLRYPVRLPGAVLGWCWVQPRRPACCLPGRAGWLDTSAIGSLR